MMQTYPFMVSLEGEVSYNSWVVHTLNPKISLEKSPFDLTLWMFLICSLEYQDMHNKYLNLSTAVMCNMSYVHT